MAWEDALRQLVDASAVAASAIGDKNAFADHEAYNEQVGSVEASDFIAKVVAASSNAHVRNATKIEARLYAADYNEANKAKEYAKRFHFLMASLEMPGTWNVFCVEDNTDGSSKKHYIK